MPSAPPPRHSLLPKHRARRVSGGSLRVSSGLAMEQAVEMKVGLADQLRWLPSH